MKGVQNRAMGEGGHSQGTRDERDQGAVSMMSFAGHLCFEDRQDTPCSGTRGSQEHIHTSLP